MISSSEIILSEENPLSSIGSQKDLNNGENYDVPPVYKWIRAGFFERNFGKRKPERFNISSIPEPLSPITIEVGNLAFQWIDGTWYNLGNDRKAIKKGVFSQNEPHLYEENEDLQNQYHILLQYNARLEKQKLKLEKKLKAMREKIRFTLETINVE